MRDLDKFWDDLRARGLVGTVDDPRTGRLDFSPIDTAIAAIRAVIDDRSPEPVQPVRIPAGRATVPAAEAMTL